MIKRYNLSCIKYGVSCCGSMQEHKTAGNYVLYKDHKETLAARDKLIGDFADIVDIIKGLSIFEQHNGAQKHLTALVKHARELVK